ncbi:hypothetical protein EVAR_20759_1 [Eumeta japonica]|uniref:Uncharacterized protein n=1 Tax=Eumeta variegata TaxID=151549 RepID=A0A4C1V9L1_EUMVA|nr:hypothetical protein EVAR_20759_1 [Eumeta japonica]
MMLLTIEIETRHERAAARGCSGLLGQRPLAYPKTLQAGDETDFDSSRWQSSKALLMYVDFAYIKDRSARSGDAGGQLCEGGRSRDSSESTGTEEGACGALERSMHLIDLYSNLSCIIKGKLIERIFFTRDCRRSQREGRVAVRPASSCSMIAALGSGSARAVGAKTCAHEGRRRRDRTSAAAASECVR